MGTLILSATAVLVVMGFSNQVLWLAAVALLYLYVRYGRTGGGSSASSSGPPASGGPAPASYRAYRDRRDQQAKWERRYSRERPSETRRQARDKSGK
ncbi:hypothetical protein PV367_40295 [Streptomyces europaeiscabiei]|uniref:Uncharacterized protein n=1 Tax=Streptomyces europaeiscabiei TaxID=146819 RepID=A0AAJ2PZC5_9ACTN|nr:MULTISPECIES: hypothetical protein [Streptomyces]KFG00258.1 hypothetical protein IQ62_14545 [Streptomyces scabiei]MDX3135902.1 hypothetical protein [Streptomyces europaeiscabiei]MDX3586802.1 hypothetical protein [Streptomyces europaeiscabiei]MDX3617394.1 hypothetical protein [Streptomyces europaeiscabiei]MDX3636328.1 hypothetical protein [Streptomyces europaeiscabiei]